MATFLPPARDRVVRFTGADPIDLAITASRKTFPTQVTYVQPSQAPRATAASVTLASTKDPALAIVSGFEFGPLLFTDGSALDPRTAAEIKRVLGRYTGPSDGAPDVSIVGDSSVVSVTVENAVKAPG